MNAVLKFGIGAALVGAVIYGVKKFKAYAGVFNIQVVKYGIPQVSNSVVYIPIVIRLTNPTPVPINLASLTADVYLLRGVEYTKVGQVNQPLNIPKGTTEQILNAAISLKSIFGGNVLNMVSAILNTKNITLRTDVTASYAGLVLPVQTITSTIDFKDLKNISVSGLGLVANSKRKIKNGLAFNKFFNLKEVKGDEVTLIANGSVYDTLTEMKKMATRYKGQTKFISEKLKADSIEQSLNNLWDFLYTHVQYKKDHPLREQLRTPIRTWKDRQTGVDCDCYSIFISTVLKNWNIPHAFRMAAYSADFQHVYVVVPTDGSLKFRNDYVVIDPVADRFNYEAPFTKKYDTSWK